MEQDGRKGKLIGSSFWSKMRFFSDVAFGCRNPRFCSFWTLGLAPVAFLELLGIWYKNRGCMVCLRFWAPVSWSNMFSLTTGFSGSPVCRLAYWSIFPPLWSCEPSLLINLEREREREREREI
jgi:hypothetical protein